MFGRIRAEQDGASMAYAGCFESADSKEGVQTVLEKRTPRFEGR